MPSTTERVRGQDGARAGTHDTRAARTSIRALMTALVVVFSLGSVATPAAYADEKDQARKLLEAGDKFIRRGDRYKKKGKDDRAAKYYQRALDSYVKAHELVPKSSIYFAVANAEVKLERYLDAVAHYQKVLEDVESDELRAQTQSALSEAKKHVGQLALVIKPEGAEISIDGELRGVAPLDEPIYLAPGEHTVTVTAEGLTPHEESLTLEAGVETKRTIELEGVPVIVKKPTLEPVKSSSRRKPRARVVKPGKGRLYLGAGLTVAMGAGATVTGLMAVSRHGTFTDASASAGDREAARSSGRTLALVTDVLVVGTVAAAAYTAYHYVKVYRPKARAYEQEERRRRDPELWISPYTDGRGGGLAVGGRF